MPLSPLLLGAGVEFEEAIWYSGSSSLKLVKYNTYGQGINKVFVANGFFGFLGRVGNFFPYMYM